MESIRDDKGRFLPGVPSVSPGRPAVSKDFRERCRVWMEEPDGGWDTLLELATTKSRDQFQALQLITNYAYGKPAQSMTNGEGETLHGPVIIMLQDYSPTFRPSEVIEGEIVQG